MPPILTNMRYYLDKYTILTNLISAPLLPLLPLAKADLHGKTVIVTGANSGLGLELALQLASMHATLLLACRNAQKAAAARERILKQHPDAKVHTLYLDTSSSSSVRAFAAEWSHGQIDVLLHNAGIAAPQDERECGFSDDGLDVMYQTNFLSSFLLTALLESKLSPQARVIFTSSMAALNGNIPDDFSLARTPETIEPGFHTTGTGATSMPMDKYAQKKLMQVAFARALQQRFDSDPTANRLAFSWEPGLVRTGMEQWLDLAREKDPAYAFVHWFLVRTAIAVEQGAATGVLLAVGEGENVVGEDGRGKCWSRCGVRMTPASFFSQEKLDKLWARWSADAEITWT